MVSICEYYPYQPKNAITNAKPKDSLITPQVLSEGASVCINRNRGAKGMLSPLQGALRKVAFDWNAPEGMSHPPSGASKKV